jgi:hypothetical protein
VPEDVAQAVILSDYAVEARYPGVTEPVTDDEYQQSVALAGNVIHWAEAMVDFYLASDRKEDEEN